VLLHWIVIVDSGSLIPSLVSSQEVNIASLATWDRARSSASVVEVVTVSCLLACYAISLLYSLIVYPWELFLSRVLSANKASLATLRLCLPLSWRDHWRVL
jgi:hypothetical protein